MTPLDVARLRQAFPGRPLAYFASIDSTMRAAAAMEIGGVAVAEAQTAGRGRQGRSWHSEPGVGIYFSMALEARPMLPLALALAARDAIRTAAGIECDIRWPNDLLVDGKKAGGILVEAAGERATAGVGVNVNNRAFPPELADEATSLALSREYARRAAGAPLSREAILLELIPAIEAHVRLAPAEVLRRFSAASSYVSGRRVRVNRPEGVLEGLTAGLDPSGFLKLRRDDGSEIPILAGGVRAAGAGCGQ